jgi:hypothetical protein
MVPFGSGQIVCHTCGEGVTDLEVGVATVDLWIGDETRRVQVCGERISLTTSIECDLEPAGLAWL